MLLYAMLILYENLNYWSTSKDSVVETNSVHRDCKNPSVFDFDNDAQCDLVCLQMEPTLGGV